MEKTETVKHENTFSVEMVKNSKGYTYSVKVSSDDDEFVKKKVDELLGYCETLIRNKKLLEE